MSGMSSIPQRFIEAMCRKASDVLRQMSGREWTLQIESKDAFDSDVERATFVVRVNGDAQGVIFMPRTDAVALVRNILGDTAAAGAALQPEDAQVIEELWQECCSAALAPDNLRDASLRVEQVSNDIEPPTFTRKAVLQCSADDGRSFRVALQVSDSLVELSAARRSRETQSGAVAHESAKLKQHENLGLVLDVELNVTLRFGSRRLTLAEIADLSSGSIIELDQQAQEPVDLLLEDRVIARGEVVVIDGNYGLRVTQVVGPE